MRRARFFALFLLGIPLALLLGVQHAFAQGEQPPASTQALTIFTAYPAQEIALGESVAFDLKLRGGDALQIVRLSVENLPEGWTATFRGGGKVIEAAYVDPQAEDDTSVQLNLAPPKEVAANTYRFSVLAASEREQARLPIELTVKEKLPPSLAFTVAQPTIQGTPETTFSYNATLKNEGDEDLTVNLIAQAPQGFQVNFKLAGQQVTNVPLTASESKSLTIEAKAFDRVAADTYQFDVQAQSDKAQAETSLVAYVVGQPQLAMTAPDGRLSGEAYVGNTTPFKLLLQNSGSAPARNIKLSASPPSGWSVTFTPEQIPEVPSGGQVEVTADIKPTDQAVAGDYMVSMSAQPEGSSSRSVDFRITVLTSTLWGIVGVALIAVAVVVVGLAVMRFGRR